MLKLTVSTGILFYFAVSLLCFPQQAVAGHEITGAPKCKGCHKAKTGDQWKAWTGSAHARAFETLASDAARQIAAEKGLGDPRQEGSCLECHTTRAFLGDDVPLSAKGKYTDSEGVGCESCHGPGSDYRPKKIMTNPEAARAAGLVMEKNADACRRCHNPRSPTFRDFDFEKRWAEVAHPVPSAQDDRADVVVDMAGAPDEITFESSVGNVLFPHKLHVLDAGMECIECHHQIRAMDLVTPHPDYLTSTWISCQSCHNSEAVGEEKYYKCADCHHTNPNNVADETLSSKVIIHKNCWKCHETGTGVEASAGCSDCHVKDKK